MEHNVSQIGMITQWKPLVPGTPETSW
jgi:hypothetical protein